MRTSRIALALLVSFGTISPAFAQAQDAPFFRLGINQGIGAVPDIDDNDDGTGGGDTGGGDTGGENPGDGTPGPVVGLSYVASIVGTVQPGTTVTGQPVYPDDVDPTLFVMSPHSEAEIDPDTGIITWTPDLMTGTQRVTVHMYTVENADPGYDSPDATATFEIDVESEIDIVLSGDARIALGSDPQEMLELQVDIGDYDHDEWSWAWSTDLPIVADVYDDRAVLDVVDLRDDVFTNWNWDYTFQAILVNNDGREIGSNALPIDITGNPTMTWSGNGGASYRIFSSPYSPPSIYIKSGESISIPATMKNGASGMVADAPQWLQPTVTGLTMGGFRINAAPNGLSFSGTGTLSGVAGNPSELKPSVVITESADGRHGLSIAQIAIVDELPDEQPGGGGDPGPGPDSDGDGTPDDVDQHPHDPDLPGPGGAQCYDREYYDADSDHMECNYNPDFDDWNSCVDSPVYYYQNRGEECPIDLDYEEENPGYIWGFYSFEGPFLIVREVTSTCSNYMSSDQVRDFVPGWEEGKGQTVAAAREDFWQRRVTEGSSGNYPEFIVGGTYCLYAVTPYMGGDSGRLLINYRERVIRQRNDEWIDMVTEEARGGYVFPELNQSFW